jgi:hypothetical protein
MHEEKDKCLGGECKRQEAMDKGVETENSGH